MGKKFGEYTELTSLDGTEAFLAKSGSTTKRVLTNTFWKLLHPRSAGEIAAGVTPTDYRYAPGNVLRYGAVPDGVTDCLAAFNAAVSSMSDDTYRGGRVYIPTGEYYLSDTWEIERSCTIEGDGQGESYGNPPTKLIFPQDTTGIRFYSSGASDAGGGHITAGNSCIRDLCIIGDRSGTTGHGIYSTIMIVVERVTVNYFSENGLTWFGDGTAGTGLPNLVRVDNLNVNEVDGNGIYMEGADSNACTISNCNFQNCGQWGIYDNSHLGNLYIGCHVNNSGIGAVKANANGSMFLRTYIEASQNCAIEVAPGTTIIGGEMVQMENYPRVFIDGDGSGALARAVNDGSGGVASIQMLNCGSGYTTATVVVDDVNSVNVSRQGGTGTGATFTPTISGGKIVSVAVTNPGTGYGTGGGQVAPRFGWPSDGNVGALFNWPLVIASHASAPRYVEMRMNTALGVNLELKPAEVGDATSLYQFDYGNRTFNTTQNGSFVGSAVTQRLVAAGSTTMTGGRSSGVQNGAMFFTKGLWLGDTSAARNISSASAMPTSGEYAAGDFVFNTAPSEAGSSSSKYVILGWSRLTTGTGHTLNTDWVQCRCLTGN